MSKALLFLLLHHLDTGQGSLVFGIDEILDRRWGPKIKARDMCRDAVASSAQPSGQSRRSAVGLPGVVDS